MAETTTIKPELPQLFKSLLQSFYKFQCKDGMVHQSLVGKCRLFVIHCDQKIDVVICQECWAVLTKPCEINWSDLNP